jgi:hypothetical protein
MSLPYKPLGRRFDSRPDQLYLKQIRNYFSEPLENVGIKIEKVGGEMLFRCEEQSTILVHEDIFGTRLLVRMYVGTFQYILSRENLIQSILFIEIFFSQLFTLKKVIPPLPLQFSRPPHL